MTGDRVAVVGLGKLGACLAACLASKGFQVVGADLNPDVVRCVNDGKAPVREPGLDDLIRQSRASLKATTCVAEAVRASVVTFIVVPTPCEPDGTFSLRYVKEAARGVGEALASKLDYHLAVLVSTVLPGGTEDGLVSVLESVSGKRCSVDFGVCYDPEFIALGNVIHGMLNPELVLLGESDSRAGDQLEALYRRFIESPAAFVRTNFTNAELAKISINTYMTMKITFANVLAELCEKLPEGDVDVITRALGSDSRIGPRYLKGGLGYGGPCFPRDDVAFAAMARGQGVFAGLCEATHTYNRTIADRVIKLALTYLPPNGTVTVLGTAYRLDTAVVEESQGLLIAAGLADAGVSVSVYDPLADEATRQVLGDRVRYAGTLREAVEAGDLLLLANPLPELKALPAILAKNSSDPKVIIDCWRCVPELAERNRIFYVALGRKLPAGGRSGQ